MTLLLSSCTSAENENMRKVSSVRNSDESYTDIEFSDELDTFEGTLVYTVDSVTYSNSISDFGIDITALNKESDLDMDGGETYYLYPDYINIETGELMENAVFLLVEITATNIDAKSKTGVMLYENGYLFRADIFFLVDLNYKNDGHYFAEGIFYFSEQGKYAEHRYVYELLPGEQITFQIGYVIGNSANDYTNLLLSNTGGDLRVKEGFLIPIDVKAHEEDSDV